MNQQINYDECREAWLRQIDAHSTALFHYLDEKHAYLVAEMQSLKFHIFEQNEMLFSILSFMERLAHIDLRTLKDLKDIELTKWIAEKAEWPQWAAETLWVCLRHNLMHYGETVTTFSSVRKGIKVMDPNTSKTINVDCHASIFLNSDMDTYNPEFPELSFDGFNWVIGPQDFNKLIGKNKHTIEITFQYPGLRRVLEKIANKVTEGIRQANQSELDKLIKINKLLLFHF